ncbi:MAG: hypothetical protein PGN13_09670 [Patulibacter minatonensis]
MAGRLSPRYACLLLSDSSHVDANAFLFVFGQPLVLMEAVQDGVSDGGWHIAGLARAVVVDSAQTGDVVVGSPELAGVPAKAEALATLAAEDGPGEVMWVVLASRAALPVRFKDGLDTIERVLSHERVMTAGDRHAVLDHHARVVRVLQDAVQARPWDRLTRALRGRSGAKPRRGNDRERRRDRLVARRHQVEGQADQRAAFRVNGDRGDGAAVNVFADVEVAEFGLAIGAAGLVLSLHPEPDLFGVTARSKSIDARHHGVEQLPSRRVVDSFSCGLELGAVTLYLAEQPQRVEVITRDSGKVAEDRVVRS